jgi:uncharacterized protein (DUF2344 family)
MDKVSLIVSGLEYKIKKIVDLHNQTTIENIKLKQEIKNLKDIIENQKVIIDKTEEKNKVHTIATVLENRKDNKAKLRINELVREIDKCIAHLNK